MHKSFALALAVGAVSLFGTAVAAADPSPNATATPGNAANANGSPFNPNGQAGTVYAGNPGTASAEHANSTHAVSQYDIACFQNSQTHP